LCAVASIFIANNPAFPADFAVKHVIFSLQRPPRDLRGHFLTV
jgi:hypothetical protein